MAVKELTDKRLAECCELVAKGQCREITLVCDDEENASDVLNYALKWAHDYAKKTGRTLKCIRYVNEVKIYR